MLFQKHLKSVQWEQYTGLNQVCHEYQWDDICVVFSLSSVAYKSFDSFGKYTILKAH